MVTGASSQRLVRIAAFPTALALAVETCARSGSHVGSFCVVLHLDRLRCGLGLLQRLRNHQRDELAPVVDLVVLKREAATR